MVMFQIISQGPSNLASANNGKAFKYVRIKERNARYPVQPNCLDQAYLINSVITPLKECGAPTVVPQLISKTLEQLGDGMLHNLRELEVTLTASAEVCATPSAGLVTC